MKRKCIGSGNWKVQVWCHFWERIRFSCYNSVGLGLSLLSCLCLPSCFLLSFPRGEDDFQHSQLYLPLSNSLAMRILLSPNILTQTCKWSFGEYLRLLPVLQIFIECLWPLKHCSTTNKMKPFLWSNYLYACVVPREKGHYSWSDLDQILTTMGPWWRVQTVIDIM